MGREAGKDVAKRIEDRGFGTPVQYRARKQAAVL